MGAGWGLRSIDRTIQQGLGGSVGPQFDAAEGLKGRDCILTAFLERVLVGAGAVVGLDGLRSSRGRGRKRSSPTGCGDGGVPPSPGVLY